MRTVARLRPECLLSCRDGASKVTLDTDLDSKSDTAPVRGSDGSLVD